MGAEPIRLRPFVQADWSSCTSHHWLLTVSWKVGNRTALLTVSHRVYHWPNLEWKVGEESICCGDSILEGHRRISLLMLHLCRLLNGNKLWVKLRDSPGPFVSMSSNTSFNSGSAFKAVSFSRCSGEACAAELCRLTICWAIPGFCRKILFC